MQMQLGLAPSQSLATFDALQRQAHLADELGFAALWAHEHHSAVSGHSRPLLIS
jgi:alkanesulfonate monooxygenase SsuD/methylene tetrahydromethanopterin reductase-like flavin-dependent oxidoreductase (luciferase family)